MKFEIWQCWQRTYTVLTLYLTGTIQPYKHMCSLLLLLFQGEEGVKKDQMSRMEKAFAIPWLPCITATVMVLIFSLDVSCFIL